MTTSVRDEIDQIVLDFLARHDPGPAPDRDEDMFETGRVNSLFVIQLIGFLENTFEVKVGVDDLDLANFATVNKVVDFVLQKKSHG
ncbi:acyl carrier protein [Streptomyces sp. NPDC090445]|uniref:acyl carrier protein n=1 Tax=Streptomyces sp. NPDC090445 TaxID=3365963 RepID=UPI003805E264